MSGRYARIPGNYWRDRAGQVSLDAHGLYAIGRSYCADQRTDGVVHEQWLAGMCGGRLNKSAVAELVGAGWWERTAGGYRDVRYLDENISRAKAEERAAKTLERVQKHRGKNDGGNDDGNGGGNGRRNGVTENVTSSVTQDIHDSHAGAGARDGRVAILEAELATALGAVGAKYVGRRDDVAHLAEAAAAMAEADPRPLRDVAREWLPHFVAEFRSRTPKNLAIYAQSRAANGGRAIAARPTGGKRDGWQPPADSSAFEATELTDDLFRKEAVS